jgi:hypothetical protein
MLEHRHEFSLALMCRVLMVARAGFYFWLHKPESDRAKEDKRLLGAIRDSYAASGGVYGYRRVFGDLREAGELCGPNRIARIMKANKIRALRGYKAPCPIAGRPSIIAPNRLNRKFTVDAPDQAWVTDITYIRTWQGWLYLAVVVDLYSRMVNETLLVTRTCTGCSADGGMASPPQKGCHCPFRSRQPIWQRRLETILPSPPTTAEHEPARQLLGQCRCRILL